MVPGHLSLAYLSCHLLCGDSKGATVSSSGVTSVASSSPLSRSHGLFSGHLSFLWCVCAVLLSPDWSPLKPSLCPLGAMGRVQIQITVLLLSLCASSWLLCLKGRFKPEQEETKNWNEYRLPQVQAACRSGHCSCFNLQTYNGHCRTWGR